MKNTDNIIKFPSNRTKKPIWWLKYKNSEKTTIINFFISLTSLIIGFSLILFIIHRLNL